MKELGIRMIIIIIISNNSIDENINGIFSQRTRGAQWSGEPREQGELFPLLFSTLFLLFFKVFQLFLVFVCIIERISLFLVLSFSCCYFPSSFGTFPHSSDLLFLSSGGLHW